MGEAKRRKLLDPSFGKNKKDREWVYWSHIPTVDAISSIKRNALNAWTAIPEFYQSQILLSAFCYGFRLHPDDGKSIVIAFPVKDEHGKKDCVLYQSAGDKEPLSDKEREKISNFVNKSSFVVIEKGITP